MPNNRIAVDIQVTPNINAPAPPALLIAPVRRYVLAAIGARNRNVALDAAINPDILRVTDQATGAPIANAEVEFIIVETGQRFGALSAPNGRVSLRNFVWSRAGVFTLVATITTPNQSVGFVVTVQ